MERRRCLAFLLIALSQIQALNAVAVLGKEDIEASELGPHLVVREDRKILSRTQYGEISATEVDDGYRGPYNLLFITLEPNSLFHPVLLQKDMVFFVHTGRGRFGYVDGDAKRHIDVQRGDISRLAAGSVFYLQSHAREKLRIFAFFTSKSGESTRDAFLEPYSSLSDLISGFGRRVLRTAFNVSDEELEGITMAKKPPAIVPLATGGEGGVIREVVSDILGKAERSENKKKTFNILKAKPDFRNRNGWSLAVNRKNFHELKGSDIGFFIVNLSQGSMMGPHWNPRATEVAVVIQGQGMVRVVCSTTCASHGSRIFRAKEGDVFVVPRYRPMAQMSFNNDSFVFVGFTTMARNNHPQFLAGKRSLLGAMDEDIWALSFNVSRAHIRRLRSAQTESTIFESSSCAEMEEKKMEREIEREKEEEERKRKEEARKREEEEAKRRQEEEEKKKKEEEAAKRRQEEEEEKKKEEEAEEERKQKEERKERERKEEEEAKRREEEEERKREEEKAKRRKEEEEAKKKEEEAAKRRHEEEEQKKKEEAEEERKAKGRNSEEEMSPRLRVSLVVPVAVLALVALLSVSVASKDECVYTIYVKTGSIIKGGTDAKISLTLGDKSSGDEVSIPDLEDWGLMGQDYDYFERGHRDIFSGRGRCLAGPICRLNLTSNGRGSHHGWFCDYVEVTATGPHKPCSQTIFSVQRWLAMDAPPYQLTALLDGCDQFPPTSERLAGPLVVGNPIQPVVAE